MRDIHNSIECKLCHSYIEFNHLTFHVEKECPDRFMICSYCLQILSYRQYENHLNSHMEQLLSDIQSLSVNYQKLLSNYEKLKELLHQIHHTPLSITN
jgi:cell shape-determining protein MreC